MSEMNETTERILIIMTGGTVCSSENSDGERSSDAATAKSRIIVGYEKVHKCDRRVLFECIMPLDILSENMTLDGWNILLDCLKRIQRDRYKGVIVLHGTDTLAYTSSLLSLLLTDFDIPVLLVSSQLPLTDPETNGHANFEAAAELILNGIEPNVYAVYRNGDGNMYLHFGAHLEQCANFSNDFFSRDSRLIDRSFSEKGRRFGSETPLLSRLDRLKGGVLRIVPYVGIDYEAYDLDRVSAIVHNTYHSESVCVGRSKRTGAVTGSSVLSLARRCRECGIDLFLAPCDPKAYAYESTGDALENGAEPISNMTLEAAYVKTVIGRSLGLRGENLKEFLNTDINGEIFD